MGSIERLSEFLVPPFQHLLLPLCGSGIAVRCPAGPDDAVEVEDETQDDEAEHQAEECPAVVVGKGLDADGHAVYTDCPGKPAACTDLLLVAFPVLRVVLVGHLLPEKHFLEVPHSQALLIAEFRLLFDVLVEQSAPIYNQQPVRVVLCPGDTLQLSCRHQLTGQDACAPLDALATVVGELHLVLVELDAVTEDAEDGTRAHDVGVEAFFLMVSILRNQKKQ